MDPVPQCQYVIRKGEKPDPGRSNIFAWSPAIAMRPDDFEPFVGPLPPLPGDKPLAPPLPPGLSDEERAARERDLMLLTAMDHLTTGDFTQGGKPKLDSLKALLGFEVTTKERDAAWMRHVAKKG
jgi:hypothetical protein